MSLTTQKYLAVGGLGTVIGAIIGCFVAPPIEPIAVDGKTLEACGQIAFAQMILGGLAGASIGLVAGLMAAWWLPTPSSKLVDNGESIAT